MHGEINPEVQKGEAEFFLADLDEMHHKLFNTLKESSNFLEGNELTPEVVAAFEDWLKMVKPELEKLLAKFTNAYAYARAHGMDNYLGHDLGGVATKITGILPFALEQIDAKGVNASSVEEFVPDFAKFLLHWERAYIALKDILLLCINKKEVPKSLVGEIDLDTLEHIVNYFVDTEKKDLNRSAAVKDSEYKLVRDRHVNSEIDFKKLRDQLKGRKIIGNDGMILSLIVKISRNGLKDSIRASDVFFEAFVDDDELVFRVMNNGKPMAPKHVEDGSKENVFEEGHSGTGSTGLGLTYANSRVKSVGGNLSVSSMFQDGTGVITKYSAIGGELPFDLEEVRGQRREEGKGDVNTIWEIRLPLEKNN